MIDLTSLLIKELMNINLKIPGANLNEVSLVDKIDQNLLKWIEDYAKIARKFNQFYKDLDNFNKNDNLVLFNIQENLLTKLDNIRNHLVKKSKDLDNILYLIQKENIKKKIDKDFHYIIQLKSVYDLTTKLEYIRSRLYFFDPTLIQKISDFCEKLTYELKLNNDLIKIFRESEPYVKDYCLNRIVENLSEIGCLVNNFCRHIIAKTYDEIEFERMMEKLKGAKKAKGAKDI
ncbi:5119_t:CDS:2 [Racocetra fulgida]|uniref:5119_t:CDS:1 n=1 Tax=Racocetra fulgida TaxID=60492 RepID=A0A9N8ZAL7_9GLOM|nr:5119_t:CDS:2 [Racocetra fulgida]